MLSGVVQVKTGLFSVNMKGVAVCFPVEETVFVTSCVSAVNSGKLKPDTKDSAQKKSSSRINLFPHINADYVAMN